MYIAVRDKKGFYINSRECPKGLECIAVSEIPTPEDNGKEAKLMFDNGALYYEYTEPIEELDEPFYQG